MVEQKVNVEVCPCCGQPCNSRNDAEKYFDKVVREEIVMTRVLFDSCFGDEEDTDRWEEGDK